MLSNGVLSNGVLSNGVSTGVSNGVSTGVLPNDNELVWRGLVFSADTVAPVEVARQFAAYAPWNFLELA